MIAPPGTAARSQLPAHHTDSRRNRTAGISTTANSISSRVQGHVPVPVPAATPLPDVYEDRGRSSATHHDDRDRSRAAASSATHHDDRDRERARAAASGSTTHHDDRDRVRFPGAGTTHHDDRTRTLASSSRHHDATPAHHHDDRGPPPSSSAAAASSSSSSSSRRGVSPPPSRRDDRPSNGSSAPVRQTRVGAPFKPNDSRPVLRPADSNLYRPAALIPQSSHNSKALNESCDEVLRRIIFRVAGHDTLWLAKLDRDSEFQRLLPWLCQAYRTDGVRSTALMRVHV